MVTSDRSYEKQLDSDKASGTADVHSKGKRSKDNVFVMVQMTV